MLTTKLQGGLGNQLFQIAAGEHIAKCTNRTYYIDSLHACSAHSNELYFDSILKHWKHLYKSIQGTTIPEVSFEYKLWSFDSPVVALDGYFQNWLYVPNDFVNRLSFDTSVSLKYNKLSTSAFLHIRGGDYTNHWLHDVKLDSYYKTAIQQFPINTHFYVFTNDIEYARSKDFLTTIPHTFVFENEVDSLYLMSRCAIGGICANSSFSWWGAYINPHRTIVMPSKWFNDFNMYTNGYYFDGVLKIDV